MRANRREFIRTVLGVVTAGGLSACFPGANKGGSTDTGAGNQNDSGNWSDDTSVPEGAIAIRLSDYPDLEKVGGQAYINSSVGPLIVARISESEFVCLSSVCTHAGCSVVYRSSQDDFYCPCHGSVFADDGTVLNGPATTPLASYDTTYDEANGRVIIQLY